MSEPTQEELAALDEQRAAAYAAHNARAARGPGNWYVEYFIETERGWRWQCSARFAGWTEARRAALDFVKKHAPCSTMRAARVVCDGDRSAPVRLQTPPDMVALGITLVVQ